MNATVTDADRALAKDVLRIGARMVKRLEMDEVQALVEEAAQLLANNLAALRLRAADRDEWQQVAMKARAETDELMAIKAIDEWEIPHVELSKSKEPWRRGRPLR